MNDTRPIGVYDSGMGGLTVWRALREALPEESLLYLGDGKNCPFGSRPQAEIRQLADAAVARLVAEGCKMVVVACNTATAAAIDFLRTKYAPMPLVGMEPAIKPACLQTRSGVVGVLATERSLDGDLFRRTAARYASGIEVIAAAGHGFVELVEEDREETPEAEACVRRIVEPMLQRGADQIVLGCTHYPFVARQIRSVVGDVPLFESGAGTARELRRRLEETGRLAPASQEGTVEFRSSRNTPEELALYRWFFAQEV